MVFNFSRNRLILTASWIGVAGSAIGIAMSYRAQYRILSKPYCVKALKYLENNNIALELIGSPIEIMRPDITDKSQIFNSNITDIKVPFKGPKKSGILHIIADKEKSTSDVTLYDSNNKDDWNIKKLELRFNDIPDKLLIVYKRKDDMIENTQELNDDAFRYD